MSEQEPKLTLKHKQKAFLIIDDERCHENGPYEVIGVKIALELEDYSEPPLCLELINNNGKREDFIVARNDFTTFKFVGYKEIIRHYFKTKKTPRKRTPKFD